MCARPQRPAFDSIRLTGGEPLVRPKLHELVAMLAAIDGIEEVALSTNGLLLEEQLDDLYAAGLSRVNVSLDTLRADRFERIARRPGLDRVLDGIDAALERGVERQDQLRRHARIQRRRNRGIFRDDVDRDVAVRFIELMPVRENAELQRDAYVPSHELLDRSGPYVLARRSTVRPETAGTIFAFSGAAGCVGVIVPCRMTTATAATGFA